MKTLAWSERILVATLLLLWVGCFVLHVREIDRTGLAEPPIFAVLDWGAQDNYPRVGGFRVERGQPDTGLRVGDRLLRIDGVDLRGLGYAGFDAVALEQSGTGRVVRIEYERSGENHASSLEMLSLPMPWVRIPWSCMNVLVGLLVLLRAPGRAGSRLLFATYVSLAILESPFAGGPRWQTYAAHAIYDLGGALAMTVALRWLILFPDEVPAYHRLSPLWAYLGGALFLAARTGYYAGGPLPPELTPRITLAYDAAFGAANLIIYSWNYRHATPVGRRRMRWVLWGGYLLLIPFCWILLAGFLNVGPAYHQLLPLIFLLAMLNPLTVLIAVVRYNLFDIDRLISTTTTYAIGVSVLLAGSLFLLPRAARAMSGFFPHSQIALALLSFLLAGAVVWLAREVRPRIDRWLFPQRHIFEAGVSALLQDIAAVDDAQEAIRLAAARITELLQARRAALYEHCDGEYVPTELVAPGGSTWPRIRARDARIISRGSIDPRIEAMSSLVVVRFRRDSGLMAFLALGIKASGDAYTQSELALLEAVGEQTSTVLERLLSEERLDQQRRAAERLQELKEAAERANLERSRFLAAASHDLRQPLFALNLLAESLADRPLDSGSARLVDQVRGATGSLTQMFDGLLDLSRLDAGAVVPDVHPIPLASVFDELRSSCAILAERKGLDLRFVPTRALVLSDAGLLRRILQNLVHNALRYTENGRVLVGCRRHGENAVAIEVLDTGVGIAAEDLPRIFEAFQQVGRRNSAEREGLGLGLSIVDRAARLLGHAISIRSNPERGTRFSLVVPRALRNAAEKTAPGSSLHALEGRRILVLDDDSRVRESLRTLLESWGCDVTVTGDVEDAVRAIGPDGTAGYQMMLIDFHLGGDATGLDALIELERRTGARPTAVLLTTDRAPSVLDAIQQSGWPCLTKPLAPGKLRALLSHLARSGG